MSTSNWRQFVTEYDGRTEFIEAYDFEEAAESCRDRMGFRPRVGTTVTVMDGWGKVVTLVKMASGWLERWERI